MKVTFRSTCFALLAALLAVAMIGCEPETPVKKEEPKPPAKAASKPEEPAKPAVKPEEPAVKAEKPAVKAETKPVEMPKVETPAKEVAAPEPKPAAKTAEPAKTTTPKAAPAAPAKTSGMVPVDDLVGQFDKYLDKLDKDTASADEYKSLPDGEICRYGNTLVLMCLALGLSDQGNKYKAVAASLVEPAQKVAASTDFELAKKAVAALKDAISKPAGKPAGELKWTKVASLSALMKQVPAVNTKLKGNLDKLSKKPSEAQKAKLTKEALGNSAVLAVIARGATANVSETKKPKEDKQWLAFCNEMRDAAAAVNAAVHAGDGKAIKSSKDKLQVSCEDCHAVFKPE